MKKKREFGFTEAQEKLGQLVGKYAVAEGVSEEELLKVYENVSISLGIYTKAPKFLPNIRLIDGVDGKVKQVQFTLRPTSGSAIKVQEVKSEFVLDVNETLFDKFIINVAKFFDTYSYYQALEENIVDFNKEIKAIIEENEVPFTVEFTLGDGILDATTDSIIIGLSDKVVKGLGSLPLFDTDMPTRVAGYKTQVADLFKEVTSPLELVKVKSPVTAELGIFTRKGVHKLLRDKVTRRISNIRTGVGYVETEDFFTVIEKVALTDEDAQALEGAVILANDKPNKREVDKGLTKIAVLYKVAPFNKATISPVEVELASLELTK